MRRISVAVVSVLLIAIGLAIFVRRTTNRADTLRDYEVPILLPLSPNVPGYNYGVWAKQGADIALGVVNNSGGVKGKRLHIQYYDDSASAATARQRTTELIERGSPLICTLLSAVTGAAAETIGPKEIVLIANTYTPGITAVRPMTFRISHSADTDMDALISLWDRTSRPSSFQVLFVDTPAGRSVAARLQRETATRGVKMFPDVAYTADDPDLRAKLRYRISPDVQAIYIYPYQEIETVVRVVRAISPAATIYTNQAIEEPHIIENLGPLAEGLIFSTPRLDVSSPEYKKYRSLYTQSYSSEPEFTSAAWFDTVNFIAAAINRAATFDAPALAAAMRQVGTIKGASGTFSVAANGDSARTAQLKTVRGLHAIALEP